MKKSSSPNTQSTNKKTVVKKVAEAKSVSKKISKKPVAKKAVVKKVATKKSPAKKSASKKTAIKKVGTTATKKQTKRPLVKASDEASFWVSDGQILNDLASLANSFKTMDKLIYSYHTQAAQNDFAEWVEAVLDDATCAAALRKAKTPKTAHTTVVRHLKYYIV